MKLERVRLDDLKFLPDLTTPMYPEFQSRFEWAMAGTLGKLELPELSDVRCTQPPRVTRSGKPSTCAVLLHIVSGF